MKKEMGIARCGLACCLCSQNDVCKGCDDGSCTDKDWCENRRCSLEKNIPGCYACDEQCDKGLFSKIKPRGFTAFVKRYGKDSLLECLARNEANGVVYHRTGVTGDYDGFDDMEALIRFIQTGVK